VAHEPRWEAVWDARTALGEGAHALDAGAGQREPSWKTESRPVG
jgi:hypothetical protein